MFRRMWLWAMMGVLCMPLAAWAQGATTTTRKTDLGASRTLASVTYDGNGFGPGLAAHYYRDAELWGGNWGDKVAVPTVAAKDWTFTRYDSSRVEPLINHLFVYRGWFSVRWNGYLAVPGEGTYKFHVFADDGCRLFIDGARLIDDWRPCSENAPDAVRTATVRLAPGRHKLVIEYFQGQSLATRDRDPISLSWECAERGLKKEIIPQTQFSHKLEDLASAQLGRLDAAAGK